MKIDIQRYNNCYHDSKGFKDNWQAGIKIFPISTQASDSGFDNKCSLQNTVGEFVRLASQNTIRPMVCFDESIIKPVKTYLEKKNMNEQQITDFIAVVRDVFLINGNLNVATPSFFKYMPLVPDDAYISEKERNKYANGQRKMAEYVFSMSEKKNIKFESASENNLFVKIILNALEDSTFENPGNSNKNIYHIPPYIAESFSQDLQWLLTQPDRIQIRYLHLLLHFYACYSITQTILLLSPAKSDTNVLKGPAGLYFILATEKASINHDAVVRGWTKKIQELKTLDYLFGKTQALDIANSILRDEGDVGYYPDVLSGLRSTPFEENKPILEEILKTYFDEKNTRIKGRSSEKQQTLPNFSPVVCSYEEFLTKLEECCVALQSVSYTSRIRKKISDILKIRFLQTRRGNNVLVIDDEMLIFLICLMTKGKRTQLEQVYKKFNGYGIFFNRETRSAIEEYLLKLNLLERKSDSGEVQYVCPVL